MGHFDKTFCIEVRGDFACFTRPEMKVERVSYDVITPSAARMIFQAIFWKPAIQWQIEKVEVLNPIKWITVTRNETAALLGRDGNSIDIDALTYPKDKAPKLKYRQQKSSLLLRDVCYRLHAKQLFIPAAKRPKPVKSVSEEHIEDEERDLFRRDENPGKYHAIFERRARKGQCFHQPYLGCREFSCEFRMIDDTANEPSPIAETRNLGFMLYDMDYKDIRNIKPMFFRAKLENGVVNIPSVDSEEVYK